jgi:hypothetical protein
MIPITQTLFKLDGESQVEFVPNAEGGITALRLFWNDGWVDTVARAK